MGGDLELVGGRRPRTAAAVPAARRLPLDDASRHRLRATLRLVRTSHGPIAFFVPDDVA